MNKINVTVWNEYRHELESEAIRKIYPNGIHGAIKEFLEKDGAFHVETAVLDMPSNGLTKQLIDNTDVLIWWAHLAHEEVSDEVTQMVKEAVQRGMGLIVLHSGHYSKVFKALMGTSCSLKWRENDRERIWCCMPGHPIAAGIPEQFELEHEEMYGEYFDIPQPDELIFMGWFSGGEVIRAGCVFNRGLGKVFYFQPGHEEYPIYENPIIQRILKNAVNYLKPNYRIDQIVCPNFEALEK
ncbi:MAG: ThuA domain-containing protein [Vallitaleaceae bacterium]|nr:ThuA domain-containing protein [Vallitaleaceae bacterium]